MYINTFLIISYIFFTNRIDGFLTALRRSLVWKSAASSFRLNIIHLWRFDLRIRHGGRDRSRKWFPAVRLLITFESHPLWIESFERRSVGRPRRIHRYVRDVGKTPPDALNPLGPSAQHLNSSSEIRIGILQDRTSTHWTISRSVGASYLTSGRGVGEWVRRGSREAEFCSKSFDLYI